MHAFWGYSRNVCTFQVTGACYPEGRRDSVPSRTVLWSHPTTAPVQFLSPVQFLACKAEWSTRRNSTAVLFSWSHQTTGPVRFDTAVHLWFHRIVCGTPHGPRARLMWASYRPRTGLSDVFQFLRDPYGAPVWPLCRTAPLQTCKGIDTTRICKNLCGHRIWRYGAGTGPLHLLHGLLRGCLRVPNPYGPVSL